MLGDPTVPDVAAVAPVATSSQSVVATARTGRRASSGRRPRGSRSGPAASGSGRFFTTAEQAAAGRVAVIGSTTAEQLWGARSPVGRTLGVGGLQLTVIGVLNTAGSTVGGDQDDQVVVPATTWATAFAGGSPGVSTIYLEATGPDTLSAAYQEAQNALLTSHGVTADTADFTVNSQASLVQTATTTAHVLTVLLGGIAAISLLVGGIGVMNIMLVSVTERTREIGLRKALGATPRVILRQFLIEASLLGLVGGVLGVGLGIAGAITLPHVLGQPVARLDDRRARRARRLPRHRDRGWRLPRQPCRPPQHPSTP